MTLTLAGLLRDLPAGPIGGFSAPVIHGKTVDGKMCTLCETFESQIQLRSGGKSTSSFYYHKLLIGNELIDPKTTRFESAMIELLDLGGWLHRDPFSDKHKTDKSGLTTIQTTYSMPKRLSFVVKSIDANFRFEPSVSWPMEYQRRTIQHRDVMRIKPKSKQTLEWYLDVIFKFRMLLSLLVGQPVNITAMRFCTKPRRIASLGSKPYRDYIDLCLNQVGTKRKKALLPPEIPFPYSVLRSDFRTVINTWFKNAAKLRTTYGLHFGTQVNEGVPTEYKLLASLQALEAYHRSKGKNYYVSKKKYEATKNKLIGAIPSGLAKDFHMALKTRIGFGNEYSLRKRLTLTFRSVPEEVRKMIVCGDARFIKRVVATRNYLTHRDETSKGDFLDGRGMYNACESLRMLLSYLLLKECGIKRELIETVMMTHRHFQNRSRIA